MAPAARNPGTAPSNNSAAQADAKLTPKEGSLFFIPVGIALSRSSLSNIEDPQHLSRVLQQQMESRRKDGFFRASPPAPNEIGTQRNEQWSDDGAAPSYAPPTDARTTWSSASAPGGSEEPTWTDAPSRNSWSDGDAPPRERAWASASTERPMWGTERAPAAAADQDWSTLPSSSEAGMPAGTGPGTRWAQLRNDRTGAPSAWENLRQRTTKAALDEQRELRARATAPEPAPSSSSKSSSYERAVAEYNRALERERMGIDETTGFNDSTQIR
ncbi:hypothetical protein MBRA1_000978 [Malassezia brasiliensis]|uniref:Uncharacterized protein n=1 Tax=Malassezia brasiliensis TaxID=1821822 RepID=A0AAF0DQY1_9BASI|nr:hypothetical protein MBRA1_000978 [Malassezia brasiliensis]